ncbi:MAG: tRNA pseudouridine(38-40) synthase TruA [Thermoanaerobaculia bacterium]|nr:tRNA pseudouridine(38-40) synthase TruA [Thermoanaerobaculia bacterium]
MSDGRGRTDGPGATARRVRLDISYLGTFFEGWQAQDVVRASGTAPRTVQATLEAALSRMHRTPLRVHSASRTDSGVHADGQVAHVDVPEGAPVVPPEGLRKGLNALLPWDVRIVAAAEAPASWHARFDALGKRYVYRLRRGDQLPPFEGLREALASPRLDPRAMRAAASHLVGRNDFAAFGLAGAPRKTTVRTLVRLEVTEKGPLLVVTAVGDGFLRGMVRRLVGTLLEAGLGRLDPLDAFRRPGPTAPARGLTLERVFYPAG